MIGGYGVVEARLLVEQLGSGQIRITTPEQLRPSYSRLVFHSTKVKTKVQILADVPNMVH